MHVRYYVTEIVDVLLKRTQRSERLCAKRQYHSVIYESATLTIRRTFIQLKQVHSLRSSFESPLLRSCAGVDPFPF
jgi:hypothetical protein